MMGLTSFPNGVSSFGMPVIGGGGLMTTGNVFFVDSGATGTGSDAANAGRSSANPFLTIDYAIGQCTASNGDIIFVMPGHTENLTGTIAMDVAGVTVMGLGQMHTRPRIVHTGTAGIVAITADNCRWSNIVHVASIALVVSAIAVSGPGTATATQHTEIDNCRFWFDATGIEFIDMIQLGDGATDSADYVYIHDCYFEAENIAGADSAISMDDCQFIRIEDNLIVGDYKAPAIDGASGSSVGLDYVILRNFVSNVDAGATAGNCIDLDDNATGICAYNVFCGPTASTILDQADVGKTLNVQNYVCDALDTKGIEVPKTVSA